MILVFLKKHFSGIVPPDLEYQSASFQFIIAEHNEKYKLKDTSTGSKLKTKISSLVMRSSPQKKKLCLGSNVLGSSSMVLDATNVRVSPVSGINSISTNATSTPNLCNTNTDLSHFRAVECNRCQVANITGHGAYVNKKVQNLRTIERNSTAENIDYNIPNQTVISEPFSMGILTESPPCHLSDDLECKTKGELFLNLLLTLKYLLAIKGKGSKGNQIKHSP